MPLIYLTLSSPSFERVLIQC